MGTGEKTQLVALLPYTHRAESRTSARMEKARGGGAHLEPQHWGGRDRRLLGAYLPASLMGTVRFRISESGVSGNKGESD